MCCVTEIVVCLCRHNNNIDVDDANIQSSDQPRDADGMSGFFPQLLLLLIFFTNIQCYC